ncbi:MAG TPA: hypothetical protein VFY20_09220 [Gemmatimonadales bacterium]|nr:hypothetical protein [Gemmatimonadales bacterium]
MTTTASAFPERPATALRRGLELTKWYVDVVAEDGRGAIAYWAELAWHGVRGRAGSYLTFGPGEPTIERTVLDPGGPPLWADQSLDWSMSSLHLRARMLRHLPGAAVRLLGDDTGTLDWNCVAPTGTACLDVGGRRFEGLGYAECLRMNVPPWRLPIDAVRWGRALIGNRSFVWIQWSGAQPMDLLLVDGHAVPGRIHADGLDLASGERLVLDPPHVIRRGALGEVVRPIRVLWPLLPQVLQDAREEKWLARAHLHSLDGHRHSAWAIHELVTLRR